MDEDIARVFQASTKTSRKYFIRYIICDIVLATKWPTESSAPLSLAEYANICISLTLFFNISVQGRLRQYDEGGHEEAQDQVAD